MTTNPPPLFVAVQEMDGFIVAQLTNPPTQPQSIEAGQTLSLTVTSVSPLQSGAINSVLIFSVATVDNSPVPQQMQAMWGQIEGNGSGLFMTNNTISALVGQEASDTSTVGISDVNFNSQDQQAFFTCGGFVTDENNVRRLWILDPELILRSGGGTGTEFFAVRPQ
jgi:hypothetical protein